MIASLLVLLVALSVGTPPTGADLERAAREIDAMLIAPCCFSQQVSVHPSAAAQEVKQDVRRRLAAGETQQQILDAYVERYGKHILAEPPAKGFDLMLYVMPFVVLLTSIALLTAIIRRVTRHALVEAPASARTPGSAIRAEYDAQLDEELRDLD
jgi:cytochrome c-type biogenesis protein CcmH